MGHGEIGPHGFVKIVILGGLLGFLFRGEIAEPRAPVGDGPELVARISDPAV